jgi:hypothetical protein
MELEIREVVNNDIEEITELFIETYKKEPWNENWKKEIARERIKDFVENNIGENYCKMLQYIVDKIKKNVLYLIG